MAKERVVTIHYTLTDEAGAILDSSRGGEPLSYLEGAGNIIPGLESQLKTAQVGEKKIVKVPAKDAYGEKRDDLTVTVARTQFPADVDLKVGDRFRGGGGDHSPIFQVMEVKDGQVTLDGNHPLAGKDLSFDVEVSAVRDASEEELSHGHAHGPDGHHHH